MQFQGIQGHPDLRMESCEAIAGLTLHDRPVQQINFQSVLHSTDLTPSEIVAEGEENSWHSGVPYGDNLVDGTERLASQMNP